jgi:hypothetical protein
LIEVSHDATPMTQLRVAVSFHYYYVCSFSPSDNYLMLVELEGLCCC